MDKYTCFWWESSACDGLDCTECQYNLDISDKQYYEYEESYHEQVSKALIPVHDFFKRRFEEYKKGIDGEPLITFRK